MKVLHVAATGFRRGAEMFAADLAGALMAPGLEQRVAVLRADGPVEVPFPVPAEVLGTNGRHVPGVRVRGGTVRTLGRVVGAWLPDVIQVHGGEPLKYVLLSSRANRTPVVYRRIGSATYGNSRGLRRAAHARLMRRAARVVAVAEAVRRETVDVFGIPDERVVTIPNAVDPSRLRPLTGRREVRRSLGIDGEAPLIISLGALTWEKDPLAHAAVAELVGRKRPDAVHLLVGEGPLRGTVEALIRGRGIEPSIRMLGARGDVPDLLTASDVLLLASRTEGMPGVVIEAGMVGLPVAAYALAGVPEVVEDGVTGALASPGDIGGLSEAVLGLLADEHRRRSMGEAARRRCCERFDIRVVAPRYLQLYEELAR